jgi:uncharacterized membrane protein
MVWMPRVILVVVDRGPAALARLQPAAASPSTLFIIYIPLLLSRPRLLDAFIIESSLLLILAAYHFIYCWPNDPAA